MVILPSISAAFTCADISVNELRNNRSLRPDLVGEINPSLQGCISPKLTGDISNKFGCIMEDVTGDISKVNGYITWVFGDMSHISGNVSGEAGDVSGLRFNTNKCEIDGSKWNRSTSSDILYSMDGAISSDQRHINLWVNYRSGDGCIQSKKHEVFDCVGIGHGQSMKTISPVDPDNKFHAVIVDACLYYLDNSQWQSHNRAHLCDSSSAAKK
jgi:hypothetical protein